MDDDDIEEVWRKPRHVFVRRGNLVIQVRGEALTVEALDAFETSVRLARLRKRHARSGALLVIEEQAPPPTSIVARRQREFVHSFEADPGLFIALILEGSSAGVFLKRTLARAVFRGPRRYIGSNVEQGVTWLMDKMEEPRRADAVLAYVRSLRTEPR